AHCHREVRRLVVPAGRDGAELRNRAGHLRAVERRERCDGGGSCERVETLRPEPRLDRGRQVVGAACARRALMPCWGRITSPNTRKEIELRAWRTTAYETADA